MCLYYWIKAYKKLLFTSFFVSASVFADVDIRVADTSLGDTNGEVEYVAAFSNCTSLSSVKLGSAEHLTNADLTDFKGISGVPNGCSTTFTLSAGQTSGAPVVEFTDSAGQQTVTEFFYHEDNLPSLSFQGVEIIGNDGNQILLVHVDASDDTDITYLSFNVIGVGASDLRRAGGVIAEAKESAFVRTRSPVRVYPSTDYQTSFVFSIPLERNLSGEEIAFDAVVLLDIAVIDAFGNHRSISKVAFTGDSIQEEAKSLIVSNTGIVINNILQTPVIIPTVDFQFRGIVSLPGLGNNISYSSSHPELIGVTQGGLVYALAETGDQQVSISVEYPGLPSVTIPIEADFSKSLVAISLEGVDSETPLVLPSLNAFYPLPELQGVFDDGSRTIISGHWTPFISISIVMHPDI